MKSKLLLSGIVAGAIVIGLLLGRTEAGGKVLGSVGVSNEYSATTTNTQALWNNYTAIKKSANGSDITLGSIKITTPGTSPMCFYDATSTVTNAEWATSTIACFPASAAQIDMHFDVSYKKGILVEFTGSPTATSRASTTITFR